MRAALHALVNAGKKTGSPELLAAVWCVATRDEHDEAGQILILGTKSIDNPRAKRRITEAGIAGLNQQLRGGMVELIGAHRLDETKIVNMFFQVRQTVRNPLAALARLMKWILRAEKLWYTGEEGKALSGQEGSRTILTIELGKLRLVLEELQLAGCASHMKIYDTLGMRGELWRQDSQRCFGITPQVEPNRVASGQLFRRSGGERRCQRAQEHSAQPTGH